MISSGNASNAWHLRLERAANPNAKTAKELLESLRNNNLNSPLIVESSPLRAGNVEGWLFVEEHTDNQTFTGSIARFAIPAPGEQFILASFRATNDGWEQNKIEIKRSFQSIIAVDPLKLIAHKLEGLDRAATLLDSLCKESLQQLAGFEEWRRIQRTASGDSPIEDIGYAFIQVEEGNIEEVELHSGQDELVPDGIIVTIRTRLVPNLNTRVVKDSYARYWVSWDGKEERWSNRVTRWMDQAQATESETGIRNRPEIGTPKSRLMVLQQDLAKDVIPVPFKSLAEDPWLPRALVWILGPVLTSSEHINAHYIWMTYENSGGTQRVVTRTDTARELPDGTLRIATRLGEESDLLWTTVDENGRLLHQVQKDGAYITGTTNSVLQAIWGPRDLW